MTGKIKAMKIEMEDNMGYNSEEDMTEHDWYKVNEDYDEYARKHYQNINKTMYAQANPPLFVGTDGGVKQIPSATMKWDSDKEPLAWIPAECVQGIAKVLAYGAAKYEKDNWRRGIPMSRYISAALRHINAWNSGEDLDPESGLPHIDHAMCGLMFVQWYIKHRPECDDRYRDDKAGYQAEVTPPSFGG